MFWVIIASYYTTLVFKYIFEVIFAILSMAYIYKKRYESDDKEVLIICSFVGANMIATSISLYTNDALGIYWNLAVQILAILVLVPAAVCIHN